MFDIDFVIPYVDNTKQQWKDIYIDYCNRTGQQSKIARMNTERYFDLGLLKYIFRGVDKFMPWIRKIHLIVQDESQVPEWVDKSKVHIVLHKDIIPESYLPTYNSTTIEMFLPKIEGLSEYFIYSNDDNYPVNYMKSEDFFTEDGFPKNIYVKKPINIVQTQFTQVCIKSYRDVATAVKKQYNTYDYITVEHSMHSMCKSLCKQVLKLLGDKIYKSLSNFREAKNYNQYIYPNYAYLIGKGKISNMKFTYKALENDIDEISSLIKNRLNQQICLNDVARTNRELFYNNLEQIENAFNYIGLKDKCKYEV